MDGAGRMTERPKRTAPIALSRKGRRLVRNRGPSPDATDALTALVRAWAVTMFATTLFAAALGVSQIWDTATYLRALQTTLSRNATLMLPPEDDPADVAAGRRARHFSGRGHDF